MSLPRGRDVTQMVLDVLAFVRENLRHRSSPEPGSRGIQKSHIASHAAASSAQHTGDMSAERLEQLESRPELGRRSCARLPRHAAGAADEGSRARPQSTILIVTVSDTDSQATAASVPLHLHLPVGSAFSVKFPLASF